MESFWSIFFMCMQIWCFFVGWSGYDPCRSELGRLIEVSHESSIHNSPILPLWLDSQHFPLCAHPFTFVPCALSWIDRQFVLLSMHPFILFTLDFSPSSFICKALPMDDTVVELTSLKIMSSFINIRVFAITGTPFHCVSPYFKSFSTQTAHKSTITLVSALVYTVSLEYHDYSVFARCFLVFF